MENLENTRFVNAYQNGVKFANLRWGNLRSQIEGAKNYVDFSFATPPNDPKEAWGTVKVQGSTSLMPEFAW
jgi:hypothetical protein